MSVLIIGEILHDAVTAGTLSAITAARAIDDDVHVLILGAKLDAHAETLASVKGVKKVLKVEHSSFEHLLAENIAPVVIELSGQYSHMMSPSSTFSKNFMPRVAAMLDAMLISDVVEIIDDTTFKRPIYAGNAIATVQSSDAHILATIRATAFDAASESQAACTIDAISLVFEQDKVRFISASIPELARPDLTSARVVVSGGRGLKSKENFSMIESLADKLNAAIGASRAAVDAGFVPNDYQVGQTGKIVAPELYIAIGISGAIQHLAGMKDSKVIVAINKDVDAPIFQIADYGLVGDLFEILPELEEKLG